MTGCHRQTSSYFCLINYSAFYLKQRKKFQWTLFKKKERKKERKKENEKIDRIERKEDIYIDV